MPRPPTFLYAQLPIVLRRRDLERGGRALQAVVGVAQSAFDLLEADIAALYDNWFVETCDDWVLPYLADLVAIPPLLSSQRPAADLRRLVANVVEYRRLKGTPSALAAIARDVSGWSVRITEAGRTVARTPHVGAFEQDEPGAVNVSDVASLAEVGTPFESAARTIDVRGFAADILGLAARSVQRPGTARELGVSVWRAQAESLWLVDAHAVDGRPSCYTFDPLGADRRLVNPPTYAATAPERAIPAPLRNSVLNDELERRTKPLYFTGDPVALVIEVERGGARSTLTLDELTATSLAPWKAPVPGKALVDAERGRFVLDPAWTSPRATITWGTGGDVGGGPYRKNVATTDTDLNLYVARDGPPAHNTFATLEAALAAAGGLAGFVRITLMDNGTYVAPPGGWTVPLTVDVSRLEIRAWAGPRPVLRGAILLDVQAAGARLLLDGVLVDGCVTIQASASADDFELSIVDATLAPRAEPSLATAAVMLDAHVSLKRSICGKIVLPELGTLLDAETSIVDGMGGTAIAGTGDGTGPRTTLRRCTVLGDVRAFAAVVDGAIVDGTLTVSAGDASAATHAAVRRLVGVEAPSSVRTGPVRFASRRFGTDGYARLPLSADTSLLAGAANGEELGAFHAAATGRRLANVRTVLDEYVPFGVVAGVIDEG